MSILMVVFVVVTLLLVINTIARDERFYPYSNILVVIDLCILGYLAFAGGR